MTNEENYCFDVAEYLHVPGTLTRPEVEWLNWEIDVVEAVEGMLGWPGKARVFYSDISQFAACGGRLRIVALTDPASVRTCPEGVGLPAVPRRGPRRSHSSSSPPDLPFRPGAVAGRTGGLCPQRSLRPRIDLDTGRQPNQTVLQARSKDWQTILT